MANGLASDVLLGEILTAEKVCRVRCCVVVIVDSVYVLCVTELRKLEHALIAWRDFRRQPARLKRELDNIARRTVAQSLSSRPPKEKAREIFLELVQDNTLPENTKAEFFSERTRGLRPG